MKQFIFSAVAAFALWVAPAAAFGACAVPDLMKAKLAFSPALAPLPDLSSPFSALSYDLEHAAIVGLWHIKFYAGTDLVDEGFDSWHSDGNEILNDTPPPATGNVCLGIFAQKGPRTFKLKHPSWVYDSTNTNVIAIATIRETVTLDKSGDAFSGPFTVDITDTFGNPLGHLDGTVKATRIKVD